MATWFIDSNGKYNLVLTGTLLTQFLTLAGISGGQTAHGGLDASDDLTLKSTAHATKGTIILEDEAVVGTGGAGDSIIVWRVNDATVFIEGVDDSDGDKYKISGSAGFGNDDLFILDPSGDLTITGSILTAFLRFLERSSDPSEPSEGECIIWMSDGTGKGDDGDVLIASKAGGTTRWTTLFDHSAGSAW